MLQVDFFYKKCRIIKECGLYRRLFLSSILSIYFLRKMVGNRVLLGYQLDE